MRTILERSRSSSPLIALYTSGSVSRNSDMILFLYGFFELSYLIEPRLVAAALKFGIEPRLHKVARHAPADDPLAHDKDIGVIVEAAHLRGKMVVAERRADLRIPVRHDGHTDAGAADQDAAVHVAGGNGLGDLPAKVGVVHGIPAARSEVNNGDISDCFQELEDFFLQFKAAVVGSYGQLHGNPFQENLILTSPLFWCQGKYLNWINSKCQTPKPNTGTTTHGDNFHGFRTATTMAPGHTRYPENPVTAFYAYAEASERLRPHNHIHALLPSLDARGGAFQHTARWYLSRKKALRE